MRTLKTITVRELIELLQGEDGDKKVIFTTDYGDYHHTPQALGIEGNCEEITISKSAYSNSGWQLDDEEEMDDEEIDEKETFLLIR